MEIKLPVKFKDGFYEVEHGDMKASYPAQHGFDLLPEPPSSGELYFKPAIRNINHEPVILRAIEYVDGQAGIPEWFGQYETL
jgi:hypothetical protein